MPELPEVTGLVDFLAHRLDGGQGALADLFADEPADHARHDHRKTTPGGQFSPVVRVSELSRC